MGTVLRRFALMAIILLMFSPTVLATNGDNLIGVGPISRSMGGVGIAYPLDAISAVFANPAAMCFGPYCRVSEFNFAGTFFMPEIDAKITHGGTTISSDSDDKVYAIPAFGLSVPISADPQKWRFGLSAYGVTGLGVDYRNTELEKATFTPPSAFLGYPLIQGEFTQLQIMKFAPAVAYQHTARLSFGLALHVDYASLDLKSGSSFNYGFGIQAGLICKPVDNLSLGLNYVSPQKVSHEMIKDFNQDGTAEDLDLESPQQLGVGAAYDFLNNRLLMEADIKWLNWSDADGYKEFDWDDQWVFAVGAQYEAVDNLFLRIGYNYGKNPVNEHNGFNGNSIINVQGNPFNGYYYETFRIFGFPAVVEQHLTLGIGYEFSPNFSVHLGYMHAFEETVSETGTDPDGNTATLESTLSEDGIDFGLTWRF